MGFRVSKNQGLFHANALIFVISSLFFFWFVLAPQLISHTILEPDQWTADQTLPWQRRPVAWEAGGTSPFTRSSSSRETVGSADWFLEPEQSPPHFHPCLGLIMQAALRWVIIGLLPFADSVLFR